MKKLKRRWEGYKPESDRVFYLHEQRGFVWFVNNSDEVLDEVIGSEGAFLTADDDVVARAASEFIYNNVEPGEAVRIAISSDGYFDLDYIVSYYISVVSSRLGRQEFNSSPEKGGAPSAVLLWKPLPSEDTADPLIIARDYVRHIGRSLPMETFINRGDLDREYVSKRLNPVGLSLNKTHLRDNAITRYEFFSDAGNVVFLTCEPDRALRFLSGLRTPTSK